MLGSRSRGSIRSTRICGSVGDVGFGETVELKAETDIDITDASLTAKDVEVDAVGTVTDTGATITET